MNLPPLLHFGRPGWWALHAIAIPAIFAGGIGLGIFHATGHGGGHGGGHDGAPAVAHDEGHAAHAVADLPTTGNPLRDEMIDLRDAYGVLVDAVALGDASNVEAAFHRVHARKAATEAALHAGTVRPPREGPIEEFAAEDERFHALIVEAVKAARAKDQAALRKSADDLLDGCVACHMRWR